MFMNTMKALWKKLQPEKVLTEHEQKVHDLINCKNKYIARKKFFELMRETSQNGVVLQFKRKNNVVQLHNNSSKSPVTE